MPTLTSFTIQISTALKQVLSSDYHSAYFNAPWNINGDRVIGFDQVYISNGDPGIFGDNSSPDPSNDSGMPNAGSLNCWIIIEE